VHRDRTTTSCLLLGSLVAWTCSLSVITAPIDARARAQALQAFPSDPVWTVDISATPVGSPVAAGDRLFVPLQSGISALRLNDGGEIWSASVELAGGLAASGDYLVVPCKGELRTLRGATGELAWSEAIGPLTAPPLLEGDFLLVVVGEQLLSFKVADGTRNWTREVGPVTERPAVSDRRLFVPIRDGRLLALDLASGEPVWEAEVGINPTEPLVHGDRVFVGTAAKRFHSLVLETGREDWVWRVPATVIGPAVSDGTRVYFAALDNLLYALDRKNGALRWKKDLNYRPSAGPTIVGATVSAPGQFPRMRAFDAATGAPGSQLVLSESLVAVPAFIASADGGPTRLAALFGGLKNVWKLTLAGPPPPPPPDLPIGPVTVLPGSVVPLGRPVLPG
jgi:outer membrane protein assembly factor BamB